MYSYSYDMVIVEKQLFRGLIYNGGRLSYALPGELRSIQLASRLDVSAPLTWVCDNDAFSHPCIRTGYEVTNSGDKDGERSPGRVD